MIPALIRSSSQDRSYLWIVFKPLIPLYLASLALVFNTFISPLRAFPSLVFLGSLDKILVVLGLLSISLLINRHVLVKLTLCVFTVFFLFACLSYFRVPELITSRSLALSLYRTAFIIFFFWYGFQLSAFIFITFFRRYSLILLAASLISSTAAAFLKISSYQIDSQLPLAILNLSPIAFHRLLSFLVILFSQKRSVLISVITVYSLLYLSNVIRSTSFLRVKRKQFFSLLLLLSTVLISAPTLYQFGALDKFKATLDQIPQILPHLTSIHYASPDDTYLYQSLSLASGGRLAILTCLFHALSGNSIVAILLGFGQGWSVSCPHPFDPFVSNTYTSAHSDLATLTFAFGLLIGGLIIVFLSLRLSYGLLIISSVSPVSDLQGLSSIRRVTLYSMCMFCVGIFSDALISIPLYPISLGLFFSSLSSLRRTSKIASNLSLP